MSAFHDKGDLYDNDAQEVTCANCRVTSPYGAPLMDHRCGCGRMLSGVGRSKEPTLPNVERAPA